MTWVFEKKRVTETAGDEIQDPKPGSAQSSGFGFSLCDFSDIGHRFEKSGRFELPRRFSKSWTEKAAPVLIFVAMVFKRVPICAVF